MGDNWIILLFIAAGILFTVMSWYAAEKRRKALAEFAHANGFEFKSAPGDIHEKYEAFSPFGSGRNRRSANLIHGQRGEIRWEMFDYRYTTGSGKNKTTHRVGVIVAKVPLMLPRLRIRPEHIFDKLAAAVGFDDIDFESAEFSRKYHVKGDDRKTAYDLIHPQMIEYLLSKPARDWQIGGSVILFQKSGHFSTAEMTDSMALISGFVERIPEYVRQDMGMRPAV